ncbi:(d)CMP kinase [uncultured Eubacterium sp.]|uniref:(d)CMP kinase n=1 Tax=uncultured Eubacterium sp. TaxID=165185 RepID=UPI0034A0C31A
MMYNIAIDGPAGAGKSTIAKIVAKELGFIYVDTGAMYRTMALACYRDGIRADEEEKVVEKCGKVHISLKYENGVQKVYLDDEDVSTLIRQEEIGNMTSAIAVYGPVRQILVAMQQELAGKNNVVMDGRDIGTAVLPSADLKIYLTASARTRAERRYKELLEKGQSCNIDEIEKDIRERDFRDMNREISPLVQAEDAVLVDSSDMDIEQVVETIKKLVD